MFVRSSKMVLLILVLSIYSNSYGVAAYMPQTLRECIAIICEASDSRNRKSDLEELYSVIKENRMLASDHLVCRGIKEALEVVGALHNNSATRQEMIEYLECYLKNLNDKAVLLSMEGDPAHVRSWSAGLIERCMSEERAAYELLRLSNELSDNLCFCGSEVSGISLKSQQLSTRGQINFNPDDMTNSQSSIPNMIFGGTGVGSAIVDGWALTPDGPQFPVSMQFIIPDDFEKHHPVSLELGFIIPNNGLPNAYANFLVQAKYLQPKHSYNPNDVNWTHTNSSGNIKITEASNPDNIKYMFVNIPLTRSHIKPEYFAFLSISRTSPTDGKTEYSGDLALVSAVFKYTSN